MRICFTSDQVFPAVTGEGISTKGFSLGMAKREHTVIVFTSEVRETPQVREVKIYRFFSLPFFLGKGYVAFPSLAKIVSILKGEK